MKEIHYKHYYYNKLQNFFFAFTKITFWLIIPSLFFFPFYYLKRQFNQKSNHPITFSAVNQLDIFGVNIMGLHGAHSPPKNSTVMSLCKNHDPITQNNPQTLL